MAMSSNDSSDAKPFKHVEDGCEAIGSSSVVVEEFKMEIDVHELPSKKELESDEKQDVQDKQTTYPCKMCAKIFKYSFSLQHHMERHHTTEEFKCYVCDKEFTNKNDLNDHLVEHNKMQEDTMFKMYKCEVCGKEYKGKNSYNYHKKTQHQGDGKTYKCNQCDRVFNSKYQMQFHQNRVHSTDEKYECNICAETFDTFYKRRSHLRKHQRRKETVENYRKKPKEATQSAETVRSGKECEICHMACTEEELEAHMSTHDVKPFKCECSKVFFSESEYKKHIEDDCEGVKSGLELEKGFEVQNDVKEELDIGIAGIKEEI